MKIACCSTLNDQYVNSFLVFITSILKTNKWFNLPYYIFSWGDLSEKNIELIKSFYSNIYIKKIDSESYKGCIFNTRWRAWSINCIERFDIFTLSEYDRVVFFDVDMLVKNDIKDLFEYNVEFGAVEIVPKTAVIDHPGKNKPWIKTFNGGLMSISSKYLNTLTKQNLIDISLSKQWSSDEPILNTFFTNEKTTFLPQYFNTLTAALTEEAFNNAKILHYVGSKKPWHSGTITDQFDDFIIKTTNNNLLLLKTFQLYQKALNEINNILQ